MKNQEKSKCCENCLGSYGFGKDNWGCIKKGCPCHKSFSKEEYHMRERPDAAPQEEQKKCKYCNTPLFGRNEEDCSQKSKEQKCEGGICQTFDTYPVWYSYCKKHSAPAKEEEDWEEEFDEIVPPDENGYNHIKHETIKTTIRNLLAKQRAEERQRVINIIQKTEIGGAKNKGEEIGVEIGREYLKIFKEQLLQALTQKHD